jgi:hypothetical protein
MEMAVRLVGERLLEEVREAAERWAAACMVRFSSSSDGEETTRRLDARRSKESMLLPEEGGSESCVFREEEEAAAGVEEAGEDGVENTAGGEEGEVSLSLLRLSLLEVEERETRRPITAEATAAALATRVRFSRRCRFLRSRRTCLLRCLSRVRLSRCGCDRSALAESGCTGTPKSALL